MVWRLCTLFSCPHYCLCVYTALFGPLEIFCLLGKASFCSVTMQVTSSIVAGHLIPFHNKNGKASISTFCHCHNNSLSVSGVEEILLLESTLRPDEVQFCSCCHCFCCCCCCCCWSRSKLKGYGFHLCLPPPIPVWYSFSVSFVYPLLS